MTRGFGIAATGAPALAEVDTWLAKPQQGPKEFGSWYIGSEGRKYRNRFFKRRRGAAGGKGSNIPRRRINR